jgi:DNA-binding response OmpR family regulator
MDHIDHILVVDDDRDIRTGIVGYLRKNGLRGIWDGTGRWLQTFFCLPADRSTKP